MLLSDKEAVMIRRSLAAQIAVILFVTFTLAGLGFAYLYHQQEKQGVQTLMLTQARVLFRQIHLMRHWNAGYGGVYVLKKPGMQTNQYLYKVGPAKGKKADIRPEIRDDRGNIYTLKNPALMARELSEITRKNSNISFHLTSLNPINPDNRASGFELDALKQFETGVKEVYQSFEDKRFRYMAPLKVEQACLKCHGFQDYKLGDIRGGLSLDLPMNSAMTVTENSRLVTISGGVSVLVIILFILWFALRKLVIHPIHELQVVARKIGSDEERANIDLSHRRDEIGSLSRTLQATEKEVERQQKELIELAGKMDDERRKDPLTKLHNRRHLYLEGPGLFAMANRFGYEVSAMMIDLDHFKKINDTYGHAAGDQVLVDVAAVLKQHSRSYDLLIRFGGEEFSMVLLNCDLHQSRQIAERIRQDIEALTVQFEDQEIRLTCSIGLSSGRGMELEQMVLHADEAVYQAKADGRNRVCHSEPQAS